MHLRRDLCRELLAERGAVAERPQVQLQRLRLDAAEIRPVVDLDRREVRLSRDGAHRRELVGSEPHSRARGWRRERLQVFDRAADVVAERGQAVVR